MMSWKPPDSEQAWLECLSAYLDYEINDEGRRALEQVLETDPRRAEQLRALRETARLLQEWEVGAPEPQPGFLQQLDRIAEDESAGCLARFHDGWFRKMSFRWQFQAALFALGVLTGILGTIMVLGGRSAQSGALAPVQAQGTTHLAASRQAISPSQAEDLLREGAANGIKAEVVREIRRRNWETAALAYEKLLIEYADTSVVANLERDREVRLLKKLYVDWKRRKL